MQTAERLERYSATSSLVYQPPQETMRAAVAIVLILFALAWVVSASSQMAYLFDGSYYLLRILEDHAPATPHNRLGVFLLQLPTLLVLNLTNEFKATSIAFCTIYSSIPFIALLLSWLVVRKHNPNLFAWPVISIGFTSLACQTILISENLVVCELVWPLFLGLLTPLHKTKMYSLLILGLFLASLHPCAIPLLLLSVCACIALNVSSKRDDSRLLGTLAFSLATIVGLKIAIMIGEPTDYESRELTCDALYKSLGRFFTNSALPAALLSIATALFTLNDKSLPEKIMVPVRFVVATACGALTVWWAANPCSWIDAFSLGRWLIVLLAPIMLFAFIDSRRTQTSVPQAKNLERNRAWLVVTVSAFFALVTVLEGALWQNQIRALEHVVWSSKKPFIDSSTQTWIEQTPLNQWSQAACSIVIQGRWPNCVLLPPERFAEAERSGAVFIAPWEGEFKNKWFRLPPREQ